MTRGQCACLGADGPDARDAIRQGPRIAELADASHFGAAISRCSRCSQHFLTLFCETVDWADGDDPQTWLAVPVTAEEAERLRAANVAGNESAVLSVLLGERRYLVNDMPKGAPATLAWITGPLYVPPHD